MYNEDKKGQSVKYNIKMFSDVGGNVRQIADRTYQNCEDAFIALVSVIEVLEKWGYELQTIQGNEFYLTNNIETRILKIEKDEDEESNQ